MTESQEQHQNIGHDSENTKQGSRAQETTETTETRGSTETGLDSPNDLGESANQALAAAPSPPAQALSREALGWQPFFAEQLTSEDAEAGELRAPEVARVLVAHRGAWRVHTGAEELWATCTGRMRHEASERQALPAVGDWVCIQRPDTGDRATIHRVLERKSKFSRKGAGDTTEEQIVAANIDTLFLVNALNLDFNLRRIERYLVLAWESGAMPVILLTKADLCADQDEIDTKISQLESIAYGVPSFAVSALHGEGLAPLAPYLQTGSTTALLGSSGAGKSTLLNALLGEQVQKVLEIRKGDHKGMHTTTARELFFVPDGGMVIDTPGMRELQLWGTDEGLQHTFEDIESLAEDCRFRDCEHTNAPGCAVMSALEDGTLTQARYTSYHKLQRELAYLHRKQNAQAQREERKKWKKISQTQKKVEVY